MKNLKINRYFFNYTYQVIIRGFVLIIGLFLSRWLISSLSEFEYSQYSLVVDSLNGFTLAVISLGIPQIIHKIYTQNNPEENKVAIYWTDLFILRVATLFVGLLISLILFNLFRVENIIFAVFLFLMQYILLFDQSIRFVCDALGRTWQFGTTDFISKLILVSCLYIFGNIFEKGLVIYIVFGLAAYLINFCLDLFIQRKYIKFTMPDFNHLKSVSGPMLTTGISSIVSFFYLFSFQSIFKYLNLDTQTINSFTNAYNRVFLAFITFPNILLPNLSSKFKQALDQNQISKSRKITIVVFGFAVLTLLSYLLVGPLVIDLIDPNTLYPESKKYLFYLSPAIFIYPLVTFLTPLILFYNKQKKDLISVFIISLIGIILQVIFVRGFGIEVSITIVFLVSFSDLIIKLFLLKGLFIHRDNQNHKA